MVEIVAWRTLGLSWSSVKQIGVRCPPPMSNQLGDLRRDSKQFVDKKRKKEKTNK